MTIDEFDKTLAGYKDKIDVAIKLIVDKTNYPAEFKEVLEYALFPGGKRLRPVLMLAFHNVFSTADEYALDYACGLEILHSYSLIHDDMPCMDNDVMRRGKPSVHAAFGEGKALLAGDALMDLAYRLLGAPTRSGGTSPFWAISSLCGDNGLIAGQYSDLYGENNTLDSLLNMYGKKTGALMKIACLSGYALGNNFDCDTFNEYRNRFKAGYDVLRGRSCEYFHGADIFGDAFGEAFQLYDDITEYIDGEEPDGTTVMNFVDLDEAKRMLNGRLNDAARAIESLCGDSADFLRALLNKFVIL